MVSFRWQPGFVIGDVGTAGWCGASAAVDMLIDVVTQQGVSSRLGARERDAGADLSSG